MLSGRLVDSQWATALVRATSSREAGAMAMTSSEPSSIVLLENAVGGKQHGEQQRDPQNAGSQALQGDLIGADADGQQHDHGQEESKGSSDTAALAERQG